MSDYTLADLLQGQKAQLEIGAVANVLRDLWQQAKAPIERRSTLNLMVLLSDVHLAEQVLEAVAEFSHAHPHRALIIFADPEAEPEETTYLALHTQPDTQIVCSEQITFSIRGEEAVQGLPHKIWPLLVAMQPILFWSVQGLPESSSLIERLQKTSARLIFDSALAPELGITLARANELAEDWKAGIIDDLNWLRLAPWREALIRALAEKSFHEEINTIQKVSVTFGGGVLDEARLGQPALLVGWLAAQWGWALAESLVYQQNAFLATWEHQGREIVCEIQTTPEAQPEILSLQLHAQNAEKQKVLSLQKDQETGALQSRLLITKPEGQETLALFQQSTAAASLAQLLSQVYARPGRDEEYEKVLRLATKLV